MEIKKILIIIICSILLSVNINAKHIIGGVMSYEALGNDRYRFTLDVFRDPSGNGALFDSQGSLTGTVTIFKGNQIYKEIIKLEQPVITTIEAEAPTPCVKLPPDLRAERGIYTFEVVLPLSDKSYHITYQRCCRNNTITNIVNPKSSGATYTVEITPLAQQLKNSSPRFLDYPPISFCQGYPIKVIQDVVDKDGDQLVFEFCSPFNGGGLEGSDDLPGDPFSLNGVAPDPDAPPPYKNIQFVAPFYSAAQPLAGDPLVSVDPNTGVISGTPHYLGQFVLAVCVSEYRNGNLLSTIKREIQLNVVDCEPLVFADIDEDITVGFKDYIVNSCGNNVITFKNESRIRSNIFAQDWIFDTGSSIDTFTDWEPTVEFDGIGEYKGTLILNPNEICSDTANIFVNIYPEIKANFGYDYDTCIAGDITFVDSSWTGAGDVVSWSWDFSGEGSSDEKNPLFEYETPGLKNVQLTVVDSNSCSNLITKNITYLPAPEEIIVDPTEAKGCAPQYVFFNNLSYPIDDSYDILWEFSDVDSSKEISAGYLYEEPGVYSVKLTIISPIGCEIQREYEDWITVRDAPHAGFSYIPNKLSNFNKTLNIFDESEGAIYWDYDFGDGTYATIPNPTKSYQDTGFFEVIQIVEHFSGCIDTFSIILDVEPSSSHFLPNAFSPNGDSNNDVFLGKGFFPYIKDFSIEIFNRWGQLVFSSDNPKVGWNGRIQNDGLVCPMGSYIYKRSYSGPRGGVFKETGTVNLIR